MPEKTSKNVKTWQEPNLTFLGPFLNISSANDDQMEFRSVGRRVVRQVLSFHDIKPSWSHEVKLGFI